MTPVCGLQCSVSCGVGQAQRQVVCTSLDGSPASPDELCAHIDRPTDVVQCTMPDCPEPPPPVVCCITFTAHIPARFQYSNCSIILFQHTKSSSLQNATDFSKNSIIPMHTTLQIAWVDGEWSEVSTDNFF
jgi:Thrombospondin type 1 domain